MTVSHEQIVRRYLDRLDRALAGAPNDRRREISDEIQAHIREEISELGRDPRDHEVLEILDRVGEPEAIAAEAYEDQPREVRSRSRALEVWALILLTVGGLVLPILGWVVGVILLWITQRWRTREKILGSFIPVALVWALYGTFFTGASVSCTGGTTVRVSQSGRSKTISEPTICDSSGLDPWVTGALFVTAVLVAIGSTFYLAWRLSHPRPI